MHRVGGKKAIALVALVIAGTFMAASPAVASPTSAADRFDGPAEDYAAVVDSMDLQGDTVEARTFDFQQAVAHGASYQFSTEWALGFRAAGGTVLNGPSVDAALLAEATASFDAGAEAAARAGCPGRNQFWTDVWGAHWEMDQCAATYLKNSLAAGAGAATIVAGISAATGVGVPAAVVAAVLAGIGGLGALAVDSCMAPGRGITVHFTGVPWCGSQ